MTEATLLKRSPASCSRPALACRLRPKDAVGRRGSIANMGEVELENLSPSELRISYFMTPLKHLNLVVRNSKGIVVSEGHFGDRFAPTREPRLLVLQSGEKFAAPVHLFATAPHVLPDGTYVVEAIFDCDGLHVVSSPIEVAMTRTEQASD